MSSKVLITDTDMVLTKSKTANTSPTDRYIVNFLASRFTYPKVYIHHHEKLHISPIQHKFSKYGFCAQGIHPF